MQPSGSNRFESRPVVLGQNATHNVCHTYMSGKYQTLGLLLLVLFSSSFQDHRN